LRQVDSPQGVRVRVGGRELINFSSNDYLGLANHPALIETAKHALEEFGVGSGASRLICGSLAPHHELEEALAAWKGTEAALTFSTGYAAALGAITALLEKDDVVILDKLVHASIVDAARLSGAKLRVFAHNDLNDLEDMLRWAAAKVPSSKFQIPSGKPRILIVTESVFSMDGDQAPLREIVELKDRYGAWLMVDEAHATGMFGTRRSGLIEQLGLTGRVEIQMATLGKALGASGGAICGSRRLVDFLINRARSFIFSTAPVPAAAASGCAAIKIVQSAEGESRLRSLGERITECWSGIPPVARACLPNDKTRSALAEDPVVSAIFPLVLGAETKVIEAAASLRQQGFLVPAIRYPAVARGAARLRITVTAAHSSKEVSRLVLALNGLRDSDS
jgi:8-amino-7-oxononanoate synthase